MRSLNVVRPCATEKKWHLLAQKLKIGSFGERETLSVNPLVIARVHVLVVTTKNVTHAFFCQHTSSSFKTSPQFSRKSRKQ